MKQRIVTAIVLIAMCAFLGLAVTAIPAEAFTQVMEHAALLSVGLQQPAGSADIISGWVTKPSAAAPGGALSEDRVILGEITVQAVTSTPSTVVPEKQAGAGVVLTQQMSAGKQFVQGVAIKNNTKTAADIASALAHKPDIAFDAASAQIQVLITHTHTTECYMDYDAGFFNPDDKSRTDDTSKNMVAVGERVAQQLKAAGIGVIHDTEVHDQPYSTAYTHSRKAVQKYLSQYPTISVVLDIHRDAIYQSNGTRVKPTAVIDGKKAAQMMIIVGMMNTKSVPNAHTAENLSFGAHLQQTLHTDYSGLMRPMVLASARYNQQLSNGMILVEVGSDVNTLAEACYSGELLGKGLAKMLKGL